MFGSMVAKFRNCPTFSYQKIIAITSLILSAMTPAIGGEITAPNNYANANYAPFGGLGNGSYQQVFSSDFFTAPISITKLSFFLPGYYVDLGDQGFTKGTYKVSLSTTSVPVGDLDPNHLGNNLGADNSVFFAGVLDGGDSIDGTAFTYDPTKGNLLLSVDVTDRLYTFGSSDYSGLFYRADGNLGTSRVLDFPTLGAPSSDNVGLDVKFTFTAVPEPASLMLFGLGLLSLVVLRRNRRVS